MSEVGRQAFEFELLVRQLFERLGFEVTHNVAFDHGYDFTATGHNLTWLVEVKHYRSQMPHARLIESAAARLAAAAKAATAGKPMLVLSSHTPPELRWRLAKGYGLAVQDRDDLTSAALRVGFDRLVAFLGASSDKPTEPVDQAQNPLPSPEPESAPPDTEGTLLANELAALKPGRKTWQAYEKLSERILRYLFEDDLYGWHKQKRTDEGLNRFDLVCRVRSTSEFWRFLIGQLRSQYVLFEFKNHDRKVKQGQVLTTEKYLLENGLRRFALMLTRKGGDDGARLTTQGAMRQHGKLILILDDGIVAKMLLGKERGDDPSDVLFAIADEFLLSLPR